MSSPLHGPPLARRILAEHRLVVFPLVILLAANALVFALVVNPLSQRVANVEGRTRSADQALVAARRQHAEAAGALTGQARASERLETFYGSVLPAGLIEARALFDPRVWEMAERAGLQPRNLNTDVIPPRDAGLTQYRVVMDLVGSYADARSFIRQLESALEFVVIDDVRLQEGTGEGATLQLRLDLSTYYRTADR